MRVSGVYRLSADSASVHDNDPPAAYNLLFVLQLESSLLHTRCSCSRARSCKLCSPQAHWQVAACLCHCPAAAAIMPAASWLH